MTPRHDASRMNGNVNGAVVAAAGARPLAPVGEGPVVSGQVQGPGGRPVSNAVLTLTDFAGHQAGRGISDGQGCYVVPVPTGGSYVLVCAAEGHQPAAFVVPVGPNGARRDLTLAGANQIVGRVTRPGGAPVADATVTLIDVRGEVTGAAMTDADGTFVLAGLHPGQYTLTATADDRLPLAQALTAAGTGVQTVELILPSNVRIAGTVRAARTGARSWTRRSPSSTPRATSSAGLLTGEDGRYEFTSLTPGSYTLAASGYAPVAIPMELFGDADDQDLVLGEAASAEASAALPLPVAAWNRG